MNIRLMIFDFDGTLADTRSLIVKSKQETMRRMGIKVLDEDTCAATIGLSARDAFLLNYPELSEMDIMKCVRIYRELFEEKKLSEPPELFSGVTETLNALKERGILCTVASSRHSESLKGFLKVMDIEKYFCYVLGSDDTERLKPNPDPVLKTLEKLEISAEETLVVGDMPFDILMGKNAGTLAAGVTYGNSDTDSLHASGADFVINTINELLEIIS